MTRLKGGTTKKNTGPKFWSSLWVGNLWVGDRENKNEMGILGSFRWFGEEKAFLDVVSGEHDEVGGCQVKGLLWILRKHSEMCLTFWGIHECLSFLCYT